MKILFIFLQVITALPGNHPKQVNSIKDLPATVETLVSAIGSDNFQVPSAFLMTMDDLRTLNSQMKRPLSEEELKTRYERGLKRAHDRFRGLKEELGQTESMLSCVVLLRRSQSPTISITSRMRGPTAARGTP